MVVYKGTLENGCLVAVKVLKGLVGSGEEFINKVATISRTSHVNIVTLLGFCFEGCNRALIYEFVPNGSLEKFIYDRNSLTFHQMGWEALNFGGVSHKSDVYNYRMMILEMVGGRKRIDVRVDQTTEIYFAKWIYKHLELNEEPGLHDNVNDEANESVRKMIIVGLWCIQTDPSHRSSMSRVVEMLEGSLESL
ncbi:hypothetical protein ACSBR1_006169 [Camellia fascicularis]